MTINQQIKHAATIQSEETTQLFACCGVFALLFMALGIVFFDYTVIVSSCIVGSYLAVRGLSLMTGGFPNEFMIYEALVN